jgi:hypothetical protein
MCSEQCRIYHSTAIPGRLHIHYYSLLVAILIGRAGKTKEVDKAQVYPGGGLFEGKPIPPLYACVQVEQLLKSSYEDNEIGILTADGKNCLGECVGNTILWHKLRKLIVIHSIL